MALRRKAHEMSDTMTENVGPAALTASDRCDHGDCGAAARVRVLYPSGIDLLFCGHHSNALQTALVASGGTLHADGSLAVPSPSATSD